MGTARALTIGAALAIAVSGAVVTNTAAAAAPSANAPATAGCEDIGDTAPVQDGFPERMSSVVGSDIRTGAHDCFERVVIEFAGTGELPGYWVRYESDPIQLSPSDAVVEIAGDATLVVSVAAWMPDIDGNGYSGPTQIFPTNVTNILELRQVENFEGMYAWAIGLDRERGFAVMTLTDPVRLVIDIELDGTAPATTAAPPETTAAPPPTTAAPSETTAAPPPTTTAPPTTAEPPTTTAPPVTTQPPATTAAPATTLPPTDVTLADHPLVGAWLLIDDSDPEGQPMLLAFSSDGVVQQSGADGLDAYGAWEPTGVTTAELTIVQPIAEGGPAPLIVTVRAAIQVAADGQSFTADYTLGLSGEGAPPGEYGPASVSATRIDVEPMGTPVGSLDELFALLGEGTAPATTSPS